MKDRDASLDLFSEFNVSIKGKIPVMAENFETNIAHQGSGVLSKGQLIHAFDQAHESLLLAAKGAVQRGENIPEGGWGPREVLAHIAGWGEEAIYRLPTVAQGTPPLKYDDEAFNFAIITMIGDQSFEQIYAILQRTHERFVQMLQALDEGIFIPGNPVYERVKAVIEHHVEHTRYLT